ncbi:hypothetical protein [Vibrio owensii]|uniref:hypothetical protein n=1 Tax=Vibrio harveyi group TaxID=717610 RepID=UPI003CC50873
MTQAQRKPFKGGVVFFPQSYNVDEGDFLNSYAEGLTLGGKEAVVFIHPTEANQVKARDSNNAQTIPTINLFSEEHRSAKNPCVADEENGPSKPCGVMVLEQVEIDEARSAEFNGKSVLVGKWASVLQADDREAPYMTGKGYLEVNFGFKTPDMLVEKQHEYDALMESISSGRVNPMDVESERAQLYKDIMAGRQKWFVAVLMQHHEIQEIVDYRKETLEQFLKFYIEKYTHTGMYGGCFLRVRQGETVISKLCAPCEHRYDYTKSCVSNVDDIIANFMKYHGNRILKAASSRDDYQLEIIPMLRLNCGSTGNNKYGNEVSFAPMGASKTLKTYVEKKLHENPSVDFKREKGFLFANVAFRVSRIMRNPGKGNLLLSAIHAFSAPQGNIYTIDITGRSAYKMDNDEYQKKGA